MAGLPAAVGLSGAALYSAVLLEHGFRTAMTVCAGLMVLAAVLSAVLVDNNVLRSPVGGLAATGPAARAAPECRFNCPVGAPPLEPGPDLGNGRGTGDPGPAKTGAAPTDAGPH